MAVKKYHNMTLEEIRSKYYVYMTGEESTAQLKMLNGKLSRLYQDAMFYFADTTALLKEAERELRHVNEQLEVLEKKADWKYICDNKVLPVKSRLSDKAREVAVYIETRTDNLTSAMAIAKDIICDLEDELGIWKSIKENLKYIADRVDNAGMNSAVEAKFLHNEPTNIPVDDEPSNEQSSFNGKAPF
jgi:hypothetical protein